MQIMQLPSNLDFDFKKIGYEAVYSHVFSRYSDFRI